VQDSSDAFVSVVVPCFNEQDNIEALLVRLVPVVEALTSRFEIILIDDGSSDDTAARILEARERDERVKLLQLSRNFGHQIALSAGLEHAMGDVVISMDGDLQHPPELIPSLLEKWREGADVVITIRDETEDAGWAKRITSRLFYRFLNVVTGLRLPEGAADFRLLSRKALDALCRCGDQDRFLRGLVQWIGFPQAAVHYRAEARHAGKSTYTWRRMMRFAMDAAISFSLVPLRGAILMGLFTVGVGLLYGLYVLWVKLFTAGAVAGWSSLMIVVLVLGGAQLTVLGIIGEYLGRTFSTVKGRPLYIVARADGLTDARGMNGLSVQAAQSGASSSAP